MPPRGDGAQHPVFASTLRCGARSRELQQQRRLLRRHADFPPEIRHSHKPVLMTYRIAALGQKVSTRAGDFADCLTVQGSAVIRLFADPVVGFKDLPLNTTEWYCKGVGLVKVQRAEPASSTFLAGGTMTLELTEWQ